jgi:glycosyltransferase involved in cell wall biosynthesis
MKITYIANVRIPTPRASGYAIMKMCEAFSKIGNQIELIVPEKRNSKEKEDPFQFYDIERIFSLKKIPSSDLLGKTFKFGHLFYWLDLISFIKQAKSEMKDSNNIIYTRDFSVPLFFAKGRNICFEVHDIPSSKFLFKIAIKRVKLFFVLTSNLKKDLVSMGVPENRIFISPSGIDIKQFDISVSKEEARKKVGLPENAKILMYTGHFYKWKGIDTVANLAKSFPEVLFVFVGGIDTDLEKFKENYKEKNIIAIPHQSRSIIPYYLKSADFFVIPNIAKEDISREYTSPLKLFEYMVSKRPIISSDLPSMREILDEENCIFAEPDNKESFAKALHKLLSDGGLGENISNKAYNKVFQYSWGNRAEKILSIMSKTLL